MFINKLLFIPLAIFLVIVSLVVLSYFVIASSSSAIVSSSSKTPVSKVTPKLPKLTYLNVNGLPENNIVATISGQTINDDMVNLQAYIPNLTVNLRYATYL